MFIYKMSIKLLFMLSVVKIQQIKAMVYNDPINVDDLEDLFTEDGCIEGTLSVIEMEGPSKKVSFVVSESAIAPNDDETKRKWEEISPLSLVNDLAVFNQIVTPKYVVTSEEGPSHKKRFVVSLHLGQEQYEAEGNSIKKAQQEAARLALNSTSLPQPPKRTKIKDVKKKSFVEKLYTWLGNDVDISFIYDDLECDSVKKDHHKDIYSKSLNSHKVKVKIEGEEFEGEGFSKEEAKQNAAEKALNALQKADGFCILNQKFRDLFSKLLNFDADKYSPISLVHEFAVKSKLEAKFDILSEEGPAHMKKYVFKCTVGNQYETVGEGSSKKEARGEAAEKMVQKLKSLTEFNNRDCKMISNIKKRKKSKSKNVIKNIAKPVVEESYNDILMEKSIPDNIDPISKLYQILQPKLKPDFKVIKEKGQEHKEFVVEVRVGDTSYVGSGLNKKTAKRKAAEGMLEKLGYSFVTGQIRQPSSKNKQVEFSRVNEHENKPLSLGLNMNSEKFLNEKKIEYDEVKPKYQQKLQNNKLSNEIKQKSKSPLKNGEDNFKEKHGTQGHTFRNKPNKQLQNLAKELGILFQFSDFPKQDNAGFVSILSLTTDPPQACYGTGTTTESSQEKATLNALQMLYKVQLSSISRLLEEPAKQMEGGGMLEEEMGVFKLIDIETE